MNKKIDNMLDAIEQHKPFTSHNVKVIPEPYGSRIFLFNKLFAIVDTDKQELFIDPSKLTKTVMKYVQSLLYYFGLDIYIYANKEKHLFLKDNEIISTDFLLVDYGEFKYEKI
ncbi:hypothetical protein [Moraxella bovis]|uniref:Uncharacterized protein n=1 Tax=Moraxella bovis TaxID=476 RepID=A0ABY6M650_MORBO|nr:hypothetical protein [Moraxella bovis]UZA02966.1 hypothetical protein LP092_13680 [Moraxella bovis]UZA54058.1 hypothetical protein LP111_12890 [Moraxella bovis]UZA57335.1 hypothetical protein LP127_01285 [Moraxella bovis]